MTDRPDAEPQKTAYRVLARKYRPASFADLIGQEAMVRTLTNAIAGGRLAHAFILTGVRGVGKTTTARIIARALNCTGVGDGPTAEPCGTCDNCLAIAQDRHVDVIEMDAASRTGIEDIRELIEGVRYRPVQARYKVYIIDEVHMLSRQAFNGLLKTLEEPPEHVIFIFATTEIRKVPITVLSRCQRFDLRRIDRDLLTGHFAKIAEAESVAIDDGALGLIARAADGSVRDGLSLLDQAIALGGARVEEEQVKSMLGLADRARIFDLFEALIRGRAPDALSLFADLHAAGADPGVVLQDLLDLTHFLVRAKLVPETLEAPGTPETERVRGRELAEGLTMADLSRAWQVLLKGLGEVQTAPSARQAAEMVMVRLAFAASLPSPAELVRRLEMEGDGPGAGSAESATPTAAAPTPSGSAGPTMARPHTGETPGPAAPQAALAPRVEAEASLEKAPSAGAPTPQSFAEVVDLLRARRETILANHLMNDVHPVRFEPGRIEIRPGDHAPRNLAGRLSETLAGMTDARWVVSVSQETGEPTLREQARAREARSREAALQHPLVQAALETFPDARLVDLREKDAEPTADSGAGGQPETPEEDEDG